MERRITEEQVTKAILNWLEASGWEIVCFDFPQSGTGTSLHPKGENSKTKNIIIPDIVAYKASEDIGVFFENKNRFYYNDFLKIEKLRKTTDYKEALSKLFDEKLPRQMYYGIGLPDQKLFWEKAKQSLSRIDFLITVADSGFVKVSYTVNPKIFNGKN